MTEWEMKDSHVREVPQLAELPIALPMHNLAWVDDRVFLSDFAQFVVLCQQQSSIPCVETTV